MKADTAFARTTRVPQGATRFLHNHSSVRVLPSRGTSTTCSSVVSASSTSCFPVSTMT